MSSQAQFEAGTANLNGEGRDKKKRYLPIPKQIYTWPQYRSEYKYGSKRICRNEEDVESMSCHTDVTEQQIEWTAEDEDRDIRKFIKELQGGYAIEVTAFAESPRVNSVRDIKIEVKWVRVTKM